MQLSHIIKRGLANDDQSHQDIVILKSVVLVPTEFRSQYLP